MLIAGIAGVPGHNALEYFERRYPGQVIGIRQVDNRNCNGPAVVACNTEDREGLARLFHQYRFRSVLDSAGNCALKPCEMDRARAFVINVDGAANLSRLAVEYGCRLLHLSVDLVFSGNREGGNYTEDDPTDPVTVYGETMVAAEEVVLANDPTACIVRISLPMGVSPSAHAGAIDWIISRFKKSRPATLFHDEIRTPTYTDCLNELFEVLLARREAGIFHAGGPRRLSLYKIAQVINRIGGYDPDLLMTMSRRDAPPIPPRAGDCTMDCTKLIRTLGYQPFDPWPLCEEMVPTDPDWHRRRLPGEPGSPAYLHRVLCTNPGRFPHGRPVLVPDR